MASRPRMPFAPDESTFVGNTLAYLCITVDYRSPLSGSQANKANVALSTAQDAACSIKALEEALERYGQPEIFNSDQDSHFTSAYFTSVLKTHRIRNSMDGKAQWTDYMFIEWLWLPPKYECVCLNAFDSFRDAKRQIGFSIQYYNVERPHSRLDGLALDHVYAGVGSLRLAA